MRVRIEGLRDLEAGLADLKRATAKNVVRRALTKAAEPMADLAKAKAPRRAHDLAESITVSTRTPRRHRKVSDVEVHMGPGPHPQAGQQEFGNRHHGPQPYLRPAWNAESGAALNSIKASLGDEIQKAAARAARKAARMAARGG